MQVDFSYKVENLFISLHNLSTDFVEVEWEAFFAGASVEKVSDDKSKFEFTADKAGFYALTLKIGQTVDGTMTYQTKGIEVYLVKDSAPTLLYSIIRQVDLIYPGMADENWEAIERYKVKWQTILFPTLNEFLDPSLGTEYMNDESRWPYFWNTLIAQLIARDIFLDVQTQLSGLTPGIQAGGGPIKKITTGPVDTEWHSQAAMTDAIFKNDGLFDELNKRICAMASTISIGFSFCKGKPFFPIKLSPLTDVENVNKLLKYGSSYVLATFYT